MGMHMTQSFGHSNRGSLLKNRKVWAGSTIWYRTQLVDRLLVQRQGSIEEWELGSNSSQRQDGVLRERVSKCGQFRTVTQS